MLKELEDLCRQSSLAFQLDKLLLPYWSGDIVEVDSNGELDSRVVTEILWELLEVNFRMELITLDRAVVPEPQGHARQPLITSPGLSSNRPYEYRLVFLKALATVLKSWPGVKPPELEKPFPVANSIIFEIELCKLEEAMAYYYTRKFLLTFHRAATIPHISPYVTLYTHLN
ncbi:hypothetical protein EV360DRAFT_90391 [Lentinula raphanica]|nr:hypothetical protein EV360DRAFT_90391 [Lentinula raphanica]